MNGYAASRTMKHRGLEQQPLMQVSPAAQPLIVVQGVSSVHMAGSVTCWVTQTGTLLTLRAQVPPGNPEKGEGEQSCRRVAGRGRHEGAAVVVGFREFAAVHSPARPLGMVGPVTQTSDPGKSTKSPQGAYCSPHQHPKGPKSKKKGEERKGGKLQAL